MAIEPTTKFICTTNNSNELGAFPWLDLISQGFSTLLGAVLAFLFGLVLYHKQKAQENMSYLQYAVSALCQLTSHLYSFKEQIAQKRYNEAVQQLKKLQTSVTNQGKVHLELRENANFMYGAEFHFAIDLEKLAFLVKHEPNLVILLGTLVDSIKSLNHITSHINHEIEQYSSENIALNLMQTQLTLQKNILLHEQLDSTMYLTEKANGLLVKFGQIEYGKKMKIKSFELTDEKYKKLKPPPIPSWEDNYQWFPKKKSWWKRIRKSK